MPVVVIASPKGGAGKSTTAVILGTELARAGGVRHPRRLRPEPVAGALGEPRAAPPLA